MRIYITGPAGSGKTTLADKISQKTGVECYHLDDIFYADEKGSLRTDAERNSLFENIINKSEWLIEDNGSRRCFAETMNAADKIVLLYPNKATRTIRILGRYFKQKLGFEKCNYKPSLKLVKRMLSSSSNFESSEDKTRQNTNKYNDKTLVLKNNKEVNIFVKSLY